VTMGAGSRLVEHQCQRCVAFVHPLSGIYLRDFGRSLEINVLLTIYLFQKQQFVAYIKE
jgi:hypothetical protein